MIETSRIARSVGEASTSSTISISRPASRTTRPYPPGSSSSVEAIVAAARERRWAVTRAFTSAAVTGS